jgi:predicted metal-dependent hydrolase
MTAATHQLQYGDALIEYHLSYAPRKTLGISVHPDLTVEVKAPLGSDFDRIEALVHRRAKWILRQQRAFQTYPPQLPPRQYVSGETHRYLGRQYRLKVIEAEREWVKLSRGFLHVWTLNKADSERVKELLDDWYRKQAKRVFYERLEAMLPRFASLNIPHPELCIKTMRTRWGSCSTAGRIHLNLKLMQVPKRYIDYIIVHELCHLVEHNHSPRFYALLDRMMPDWRERRQQINECDVR